MPVHAFDTSFEELVAGNSLNFGQLAEPSFGTQHPPRLERQRLRMRILRTVSLGDAQILLLASLDVNIAHLHPAQ